MKKRKQVNGVSFPAWFTISLIAIMSLAVRCTVHFWALNETATSIISDLSISVLSIAILDFFLTVSSEQKLVSSIVDNIQYNIAKNEDFHGLSKEEKAELVKKIYLICFNLADPAVKGWYPNYVDQYCQSLSADFSDTIKSSTYYSEYTRHVDIILRDQDIKVDITYKLTICNPALEKCIYRHDPMFSLPKEFDSYQVKKLIIDDKDIEMNVSGNMKKAYTNSMYYSGKKIERDLSHKAKTTLVQESAYETDYNQFFQTYWLRHPCENFRFEAEIIDQRSKADTAYILHWEFFGPLTRSQIARSGVHQTDFSVSTDTIKNIPQGSGFVLCLGSKKQP